MVRCRTKIWATQVVMVSGSYRSVTGWHFNNLTYLPQPRAAWGSNPLAGRGVNGGSIEWTSSGRRWRTECNTRRRGREGAAPTSGPTTSCGREPGTCAAPATCSTTS
ncbi:hypothetical protein G7085_08260 [Tessaracoccus sp. HDW20]|uniref:hypothetical protein n=1 Tax=Tessaracoccus coleopterorum TaxID=2714950 RepID=UPI0018D3432A|nr:hypothetical protein [Tessaracoccus coleopterorum]NHB84606.1 hypothetical protein [Tessaracoccus coleopterorum]